MACGGIYLSLFSTRQDLGGHLRVLANHLEKYWRKKAWSVDENTDEQLFRFAHFELNRMLVELKLKST